LPQQRFHPSLQLGDELQDRRQRGDPDFRRGDGCAPGPASAAAAFAGRRRAATAPRSHQRHVAAPPALAAAASFMQVRAAPDCETARNSASGASSEPVDRVRSTADEAVASRGGSRSEYLAKLAAVSGAAAGAGADERRGGRARSFSPIARQAARWPPAGGDRAGALERSDQHGGGGHGTQAGRGDAAPRQQDGASSASPTARRARARKGGAPRGRRALAMPLTRHTDCAPPSRQSAAIPGESPARASVIHLPSPLIYPALPSLTAFCSWLVEIFLLGGGRPATIFSPDRLRQTRRAASARPSARPIPSKRHRAARRNRFRAYTAPLPYSEMIAPPTAADIGRWPPTTASSRAGADRSGWRRRAAEGHLARRCMRRNRRRPLGEGAGGARHPRALLRAVWRRPGPSGNGAFAGRPRQEPAALAAARHAATISLSAVASPDLVNWTVPALAPLPRQRPALVADAVATNCLAAPPSTASDSALSPARPVPRHRGPRTVHDRARSPSARFRHQRGDQAAAVPGQARLVFRNRSRSRSRPLGARPASRFLPICCLAGSRQHRPNSDVEIPRSVASAFVEAASARRVSPRPR